MMRRSILNPFGLFCLVSTAMVPSMGFADGFFYDLFHDPPDCVQLTASQEWLYSTRNNQLSGRATAIEGTDAGRLDPERADFSHESGYRLSLGVQTRQNRVEVIFANHGTWFARNDGQLTTGLSFDNDVPGNWPAGSNILSATTFFDPLRVASTALLGGEGDEADGLGPSNTFADVAPTYRQFYQSQMQDLQINWMDNDPCSNLRFGIGFRNVQLDEVMGTEISGTFRADDGGGGSGGLSHATLTGVAGLQFLGGTANGFEDASAAGNNGIADTLTLIHNADTSNQLNGIQGVMEVCLLDNGRLSTSLLTRVGVYHNHASGLIRERYTGVGDDTSVYGRSFRDTQDSVAFVGGLGLRSSWQLSRNWKFVGGYSGTFISGLALAPEQTLRGNTYEVHTNGSILVHGGTAGLEFTY